MLRGAHCADLFAGSGALGLEALSRGAAHCDFIDRSEAVCKAISKHLLTLNASDRGQVFPTTAGRFLRDTRHPFDLVFIDPPFGEGLVEVTCRQLEEQGRLAAGAMVYTESGANEAVSAHIAAHWQLHREKTMGGVTCRLYALTTASCR
jgi:16S rRNA (guanine966-N2)-methyltransferase